MKYHWITGLLLLTAAPAAAQRTLDVPADKGWQHAETGLILTAAIDGLPRTRLTDSGTQERDVAAQFNDAGDATSLTIYIFRPALTNAAVWFDRAATVLAARESYGGVTPVGAPQPFARPGGSVTSGLRQVFVPMKGPYRATALAVVPLGDWLVAVRLSSIRLDAAAIAGELDKVLGAIRWPKAAEEGSPAVPIAACATMLKTQHAKLTKPDMSQALLAGVMGGLVLEKASEHKEAAPAAPPTYCRDGTPEVLYGMYRRPEQTDGYLVAIADSGRVAYVDAATVIPGITPKNAGYSVSYYDLDASIASFPPFDRLPQPQQVAELVLNGTPTSRTTRDAAGKSNVTLNAPK